jgi:DNA-binding CsgD family transcriptional regulator
VLAFVVPVARKSEVAEVRAAEALALCRWLPGHDGEGIYGIQMFCIRREQGRLRELAPAVEHFVNTTNDSAVWQPGLALVYAELGAKAKAAELFYRLAENDFASLPRDGLWVTCLGYAAEVCAFLDAKPQASTLYRLLLSHQGLNIVIGANIGCLGAADRFLGMLAATRDDWPVADAHFRRALAVDEKQGFSVWAAHTRYQYAAMLARRRSEGDRQRAQEYLDEALETATKLGMPTLAQRIVELRQRVRSVPGDRPVGAGLSKREVEVIRLIAAGNNNKEIGRTLFISTNTVAAHVRNILEKTHTGNRTEAAAFAADHGLLPARVRDSQAE